MNTIFKLDSSRNIGSQKFSISNFFACYKSFFRATMPYEALSYCLRVKSHEQIKQASQNSPVALLAGPAAGMFSQLAMHFEFVRSIKNQTKSDMQSIMLKRFDALGLVALRGALLGLCHLTVEDLCLEFLE